MNFGRYARRNGHYRMANSRAMNGLGRGAAENGPYLVYGDLAQAEASEGLRPGLVAGLSFGALAFGLVAGFSLGYVARGRSREE